MADDTPFGLKPKGTRNGAAYNARISKYYKASGYATAVFIGDAVVRAGSANTAEVTSGTEVHMPGTLPDINRATVGDGNAITGVVVGFEANPDAQTTVHSPASTEQVVLVCDDPYAEFEIQADGTLAATQVGLNAVLIDTHSGSTNTGLSGTELDTTSDAPAADASNQLTILRFTPRSDNDIGTNSKVDVRITNHTEAHGALGI